MSKVILVSSILAGLVAIMACYGLFIYLENETFSYKDAARFVLFEPLLLCVIIPVVSTSVYLTQSKEFKKSRNFFHAFVLAFGAFTCFYLFDFLFFILLPEYSISFQTAFNDFLSQNGSQPSTKNLPLGYQCLFVNILPLVVAFIYSSLAIRIFREKGTNF